MCPYLYLILTDSFIGTLCGKLRTLVIDKSVVIMLVVVVVVVVAVVVVVVMVVVVVPVGE